MSTHRPPQFVLATGETITLTADEGSQLLTALRSLRARKARTRNVAREVGAFVECNPGSSTIEIARAIRARDSRVREVLESDPLFENVPAVTGRPARLRAWIIARPASQPGPNDGTTTFARRNGRAS